MATESKQAVLDKAKQFDLLLDNDAAGILGERSDFELILRRLAENNEWFVSAARAKEEFERLDREARTHSTGDESKKSGAFERPKLNFRILSQYDVTEQSFSEGTVKNFLEYFRKKFSVLSEMLRKRHGLSPRPISRLRAVNQNAEVDLVGMVFKKWITKNGHVALTLEDTENTCIALVLKTDLKNTPLAQTVLPDNVIAIKASKLSDDMVIIKDILFPDLPMRKKRLCPEGVNLVHISDIHVGSKLFMEKEFSAFLEWISGRHIADPEEAEQVRRIKYLVITGDNVDGIGVYPSQINELAIKDISKQYEAVATWLSRIPDDIEVFITPGNHDAVRNADPMPAIAPKFRFGLAEKKNVHFVGSPAWLEIEGLKMLLYHGGSFHDLISSVSFLDHDHPELAMRELLKKRDLMPSYGLKNTVVPEKTDFLTIQEEPDYVFNGDMHKNGYVEYRGCTVINAGTWQDRTEYQVKLGHHPTPAIAVLVELDTGRVIEKNFQKNETKVVAVPAT